MPKTNSKKNINIIRENWGKEYPVLPQLDLLDVQKKSYKWFLEKGIGEILKEVSPIDDFTEKNWRLEFKDYHIGKPTHSPDVASAKGLV